MKFQKGPTFDIWFWLLVIWSFVVPYIWDDAHAKACDERGQVIFDRLFSSETFNCTRAKP